MAHVDIELLLQCLDHGRRRRGARDRDTLQGRNLVAALSQLIDDDLPDCRYPVRCRHLFIDDELLETRTVESWTRQHQLRAGHGRSERHSPRYVRMKHRYER